MALPLYHIICIYFNFPKKLGFGYCETVVFDNECPNDYIKKKQEIRNILKINWTILNRFCKYNIYMVTYRGFRA